jgi:hypothetical protein
MIKAWFYISTEKLWYRANCLLFSGLAELSTLNAHYLYTFIGGGNTCFYPPDCGKNICFDGFFLTGKFWGKL